MSRYEFISIIRCRTFYLLHCGCATSSADIGGVLSYRALYARFRPQAHLKLLIELFSIRDTH